MADTHTQNEEAGPEHDAMDPRGSVSDASGEDGSPDGDEIQNETAGPGRSHGESECEEGGKERENPAGGREDDSDPLKAIVAKMEDVLQGQHRLEEEFKRKLTYDRHKEKIIDNLHAELQVHKNNFVKKILQPVVMDVILVMDDMDKTTRNFKEKEPSDIDPLNLLNLFDGFRSDLEDLLYKQRVEPFECNEERFDPSRQKVGKIVEVHDREKEKTVAERLRSGFEWEGEIIRPELVAVNKYKEEVEQTDQGGGGDHE